MDISHLQPQPQPQPQTQSRPLKLYFVPYLAAGHMIPLCDIATIFASLGHHVTIITTPSNAQILQKSNPSPHNHFQVHTVDFPSREVGLPGGIENMAAVSDFEECSRVHRGAELLQAPIEDFIQHHPPDCIVADFMHRWIPDLAERLQIPRLSFNGFCLFAVCAMQSVQSLPEVDSDSYVIPGLPHSITMNARAPKLFTQYMEPLMQLAIKSHGLIVNSFRELDGEEYVEHYERTTGRKAWHVGPASLVRRSVQEQAERGQKSVVSEHECLSWLNSKAPNSVLYICFGSICRLPDSQLYEIACGIEASGHEFIWVVPEKKGKEGESEEEKQKWVPKGFEGRNEGKGMIIRGWAPQVLILGHHAVGGFVSHCCWNSTVEAISAGVPMITWPIHGEQFYNEKLITQVHGIGVELGVEEWSLSGYGNREKLVSRDEIEKAVRKLFDGGDEAYKIRRRAKELGKKAREAVHEGGSSHENFTAVIDDLKRLRDSKPLD